MPDEPRPPRLAEWILERLLPESDRLSVLGDLDEAMRSKRASHLWYWSQVVLFGAGYTWARATRWRGPRRHGMNDGRQREVGMTTGCLMEIRLAARTLARRPGFSTTVALTLALGIGGTTAIFSVVDGALLRPLSLPESDRLLLVSEWFPERAQAPGGSSVNDANIAYFQETLRSVSGIAPYGSTSLNISAGDRPERIRGMGVEHHFLGTLGVLPLLGRDFLPEEDVAGGPNVMIISHGLWVELFASDPDVLGRTLRANDEAYEIIGVLPEDFDFPGAPRLLYPLGFHGREYPQGGRQYYAIARLADGATLEAARREIEDAYTVRAEAYAGNEGWSAWLQPLADLNVGRSQRRSLLMLAWAVAGVLLIACLNVANLLLVRAETRQRELAVRVALGAGRARLVPHFLAEGVILSAVGGTLGIAVGYAGLEAIRRSFSAMLPRAESITLDLRTLAFSLGITALVGLGMGLVPLLRMRGVDLQSDLREGSRDTGARAGHLRRVLVVTEVALSVVILSVTGLLANSFYRVAQVDVGLDTPERVLVAQLALGSDYSGSEERVRLFEDLIDQAEALPGVTAVGLSSRLPLYGGSNFTSVSPLGEPDRAAPFVEWRIATPGLFDAVGIRLEEGRMLGREDAASDTLRSILITREMARQLFPGGDAVGQRIDPFRDDIGLEIVGVVSDLRDFGHEEPAPPGMYAPYGNARSTSAPYLFVRTGADPLGLVGPLRDLVSDLDPELPLFGVRTLEDVVEQRLGGRRFSVSLLMVFASTALLLGIVGIYGVVAYSVAQRTRELGVRMALGAGRSDVVRLVVRDGFRLTLVGLGVGLAGAWVSARWVGSQLYGVEPTDPLTYGTVAALLGIASLAASYLPARRASRTDPQVALRAE